MLAKIKQFFFVHQSTRQVVLKNTLWIAAAEVVSRFFKFFLVVFIARELGALEYGKFAVAMAFVSFFAIFSNLGIPAIMIREFSRDRERERDFPNILSLKLFLALFMVASVITISTFAVPDPSIRIVVWILAFYMLAQSLKEVFYAFFNARQRMEYESGIRVLDAFMLSAIGLFIVFNFPSVKNISFGYAASNAIIIALLFVLFHRKFASIRPAFDFQLWKRILSMSWPLGLVGIFGAVLGQIDTLMLGFFGKIQEAGWYDIAYGVFGVIQLPMVIIGQSFFPVLSRAYAESKETFQKAYFFQMEIMVFLAAGFFSGGMVLASRLIDFVYDPRYLPATLALQILLGAIIVVFVSGPPRLALIVNDRQRIVFIITFVGAALNAILDLFFIPRWSLYGTAAATLISYTLMCVLFIYFTRVKVGMSLLNKPLAVSSAGAVLAGTATYFFLLLPQVKDFHVMLSVASGGLIYLAAFTAWRFLWLGKPFPS